MPGYRVHLVGGGVAAGAVCCILVALGCVSLAHDYLLMSYCFVAALAGALFPDIDVKSKGQNYFYWIVFLLLIYYYTDHQFDRCAAIGLICMLPLLTKHRGILHNIWFLIFAVGCCMALIVVHCKAHAMTLCPVLSFFLVGMISHLWLDLGVRRMLRLPRWK
jgi:membrane-bound metal-dependent hydrolase YbcI (DUF457 family)